jgi:hypothetical protein
MMKYELAQFSAPPPPLKRPTPPPPNPFPFIRRLSLTAVYSCGNMLCVSAAPPPTVQYPPGPSQHHPFRPGPSQPRSRNSLLCAPHHPTNRRPASANVSPNFFRIIIYRPPRNC